MSTAVSGDPIYREYQVPMFNVDDLQRAVPQQAVECGATFRRFQRPSRIKQELHSTEFFVNCHVEIWASLILVTALFAYGSAAKWASEKLSCIPAEMEKYEKIRVVGRGAYGTVYLCKRIQDNKLVIIKQIPVEQMTVEERQSALNEVKVLSMLDHPNIVKYYENFLEDKALMIVMEYAEGGTLFEYLQSRNGRLLDEEDILHYFAQMLLSLQHVHSKQILHRDLKTQNILMDKHKRVVTIGDFGISKVLSSKSKAYTVVGTPCYISPELCEGKPYNQKSDIWALGCVLYELTTLKRAFEAQNLPALILKIMRGTFAPIADHYSEDLRQLIITTLHLDPSKRPNINQIMAMPIILNSLISLYTDFGKVPCRRAPRPLSSLQGQPRVRVNRGKGSSASMVLENSETLSTSKTASLTSVYTWGGGIVVPVKLSLPSSDTRITQVATGRTQKTAVTKNGRLIVWETPAVNVEQANIPGTAEGAYPMSVPRYLEGQSAVTIQHVACGDLFTACLTDRGILMTFGSGANGCLGHGNYNDVSQAKIVETLLGFEVMEVSCGASHMLVVTSEHEVFAWGRGDNGRLGLGSQDSHCCPQQVSLRSDCRPCSVLCAIDCSMVITLEGQLLCSGSNRYNKLALDENEHVEEVDIFIPVRSPPLSTTPIKSVAMGTSHAAVITENYELITFGSNQFGQLGHGNSFSETMPQKVESLAGRNISLVSCGDTFTVAATEEGQIFSWGKNARGRLGRLQGDSSVPGEVPLPDEDGYKVMSMCSSHGNTLLAIKSLNDSDSMD